MRVNIRRSLFMKKFFCLEGIRPCSNLLYDMSIRPHASTLDASQYITAIRDHPKTQLRDTTVSANPFLHASASKLSGSKISWRTIVEASQECIVWSQANAKSSLHASACRYAWSVRSSQCNSGLAHLPFQEGIELSEKGIVSFGRSGCVWWPLKRFRHVCLVVTVSYLSCEAQHPGTENKENFSYFLSTRAWPRKNCRFGNSNETFLEGFRNALRFTPMWTF
jgi:hypothetical protein